MQAQQQGTLKRVMKPKTAQHSKGNSSQEYPSQPIIMPHKQYADAHFSLNQRPHHQAQKYRLKCQLSNNNVPAHKDSSMHSDLNSPGVSPLTYHTASETRHQEN
jgi:hypothetical protein